MIAAIYARAAALAAILVITLASSAWAECAWVLWGRDSTNNTWTSRAAFATKAECQSEHLRIANESYRGVTELRRPEFKRHDYFECWPDTVDPRAPKSSGR
jgi:hypothetical protein